MWNIFHSSYQTDNYLCQKRQHPQEPETNDVAEEVAEIILNSGEDCTVFKNAGEALAHLEAMLGIESDDQNEDKPSNG